MTAEGASLHGVWRSREWQTGIPNLVRATKTDHFQMCATILLALIELDCHSRERQTPCRGALTALQSSVCMRQSYNSAVFKRIFKIVVD